MSNFARRRSASTMHRAGRSAEKRRQALEPHVDSVSRKPEELAQPRIPPDQVRGQGIVHGVHYPLHETEKPAIGMAPRGARSIHRNGGLLSCQRPILERERLEYLV